MDSSNSMHSFSCQDGKECVCHSRCDRSITISTAASSSDLSLTHGSLQGHADAWHLWNTNTHEAHNTFEASLCSEKRYEDARHNLGLYAPAYEGCLTPEMECLREKHDCMNSQLKYTLRQKVDEAFKDWLCVEKKQGFNLSCSPSPSIRSSRSWAWSKSATGASGNEEIEGNHGLSGCSFSGAFSRELGGRGRHQSRSPSMNSLSSSVGNKLGAGAAYTKKKECDTIEDALHTYFVDVQTGLSNERSSLFQIWQQWNTNEKEAQKTLEHSLCREKKVEDAKHTPSIHPLAYESCLTPRMEWLRGCNHERNIDLLCTPPHKVEEHFRDSLRPPKCLFRSRSSIQRGRSLVRGQDFFRSHSLSRTRPGSHVTSYSRSTL